MDEKSSESTLFPARSKSLLDNLRLVSHIKSPFELNYASEFYKKITKCIKDFDESLDPEHEVGIRLVNFGQMVIFHLEDIGYWNPSLLSFKGITDNGEPVELIQHVSQISILLIKMKRKNPSEPKKPIGFSVDDKEDI